MNCLDPPLMDAGGFMIRVRCGQCKACRIRRQMCWTFRNMIEFSTSTSAEFWTLTYRDEDCPEKLDYSDFSAFMKRWRARNGEMIRFFAVGEYGGKTGRPHWHCLIYNTPQSPRGLQAIKQWPFGFVYIGEVTPQSIRYTARYTLKFGQKGEEAMMRASLRPAIGENGLRELGREYARHGHLIKNPPTFGTIDGKRYPFDASSRRYFLEGYAEGGGTVPEMSLAALEADTLVELMYGDPVARQKLGELARLDWETARLSSGTF